VPEGFSFFTIMNSLKIQSIFFGIFLLCITAVSKADAPYPAGEKFKFKAYALGIIPIGTVWMDISTGMYENIPTHLFKARCLGDYIVYVADVRVFSHLSKQTDKSVFHAIEQYGTERRGRRLLFSPDNQFVKYVRLEDDGEYRPRCVTKVAPDIWDVFGGAFQARKRFNTALGASTEIKIIEKRKVFHLKCTVVERKPLTIEGVGTFDAVRVQISALNLKPDEIFKGLLNLDRDVEFWIDSSTATPLLMITTVPFGFLRPKIKLVLREWQTVPGFEPKLLPPPKREKIKKEKTEI